MLFEFFLGQYYRVPKCIGTNLVDTCLFTVRRRFVNTALQLWKLAEMGDTAKPTVKVLNEQPKAGKSDLKAPDLAKKLQKTMLR